MTSTNVKKTCDSLNLETPCYSASYTQFNGPDCVDATIPGYIDETFILLSTAICANNNPRECSQLHGIYVYMKDYGIDDASCGVTNSDYCETGSDKNNEFSLCAKRDR